MFERKKKSHRGKDVTDDNVSLVPEDLSRSASENFVNLFLALCEEYEVTPVPKILTVGNILAATTKVAARRRSDHREVLPTQLETPSEETDTSAPPLIYVTYEKAKEFGNPEKIECRGHEISVCMLDALSTSIDKFRSVTTIRLRNCRINAYGISQIGEIIAGIGCVRDLNLDMNPNTRENYHLLCSPARKLRYLSLKYCNISDRGLEKIANELKYREAETPQLIALDLANNRITDLGAEHIAAMLHTNRHRQLITCSSARSLQSLILAGNRITDDGAVAMIRELCMYPLSHDEIVNLRRMNFQRLLANPADKSRDSIRDESRISTASSRQFSSRKSSKTKTRKTGNKNKLMSDKRESSSVHKNLRDTGLHPFIAETRRIKGQIMVAGNFELQHLNLSYNHLTNETLKEMAKCLFYQNYEMLGDPSRGLIHVNLEGNDFQTEGNESFDQLRELLRDRGSSGERANEELIEARAN